MYYTALMLLSVVILFITMLCLISAGYRIGKKSPSTSALNITEGAVFTLMALLVAFSFSSANQRYDQRRLMVIEEANAINTAYLRLDMLEPNDRSQLRSDFLDYINSRLAIYQAIPDMNSVAVEIKKSAVIQDKLWRDAISACHHSSFQIMPMFILSSINTMFDIANARMAYTYLHPHFLIFTLLFLVTLLSAFLTGYGMAGKGTWASIHIIAFVLIIATTIYIILDLEYPRLGFIRESHIDALLIDVKNNMAK